jgi:hypothetical protein
VLKDSSSMTAVTGQPGIRGQTAIAAMPQISDETGILYQEQTWKHSNLGQPTKKDSHGKPDSA